MSAEGSTLTAQSSLTHSQQRSDAQPVRPKAAKCTDSHRTVPVRPEGLGTRLFAKQVRIADGAPEANAVSSEADGGTATESRGKHPRQRVLGLQWHWG